MREGGWDFVIHSRTRRGNLAHLAGISLAARRRSGHSQGDQPVARQELRFLRRMKWFFSKAAPLALAAFAVLAVSAQTNVPTVIVTVSRARLIEGTLPEGNAAFFVFSSSDTRGAVLRVEFSGDASAQDFSEIVQSPTGGVHRALPTTITIPDGSSSTTLSFQSASDVLVEGPESFAVRIVPDAAYKIGASSEVGFTITDRTIWSTNKGPSLGFYPRGGTFEWQPTLPFSIGVGGYQTLDLKLVVDNVVVDELLAASPPATNVFRLNWANPTLGRHVVQFAAYDERGGSAVSPPAEIDVVKDMVEPARTFTLSLPTGYFVNTNVHVYNGTSPSEERGFVEFDVPAAATNQEAIFQFGGRVTQRVDLLAYAAGPTNFAEVIRLPREYIGSVQTNSGAAPVQFDVTPWVREFAGEKLGAFTR